MNVREWSIMLGQLSRPKTDGRLSGLIGANRAGERRSRVVKGLSAFGSFRWKSGLCADECEPVFHLHRAPLITEFADQLLGQDRAIDVDPRPIWVMLLNVPDGPQYRIAPDLPTLREEYGASSIKIGLPIKPSAVFVALNDPDRSFRLPLKRGVEDDRDFHVGNLLDGQMVRNGKYQGDGALLGAAEKMVEIDLSWRWLRRAIRVAKPRSDLSRHLLRRSWPSIRL